jgi:hypothetical protein
MTTTHPETSRNHVRIPATVAEAQAEAAWLVAITHGDEEQRDGWRLGHLQLSRRQPPVGGAGCLALREVTRGEWGCPASSRDSWTIRVRS